jgi:hypothetical protein
VDGAWRTYDPTPPGASRGEPGRRIAAAIDAIEMRWYRYVINYTLEDQAEVALAAMPRAEYGVAVAGLVELADEPRRRARR